MAIAFKQRHVSDTWLALFALLLTVVFDYFFNNHSREASLAMFAVITFVFIYILREFRHYGTLGIVVFSSGLILYVIPYLGYILRGVHLPFVFYSLFNVVALILLFFSRFFFREGITQESTVLKGAVPLYCIFILFSFVGLHVWMPVHAGFLALALLMLGRICGNIKYSHKKVLVLTSFIYLLLLYDFFMVWNGFGRLLFLIYLILPVLVLYHYRRISLSMWQFHILIPFGMLIGIYIRAQDGFRLALMNFGGGSVGHHLELMKDISLSLNSSEARISELFGQFSLYFLNWFPRDIWQEKPVGISFWFVDEFIGREGYGDVYNVSLGLWGEHMYLLPGFWPVSGLFLILLTGLMIKIVYVCSFRSAVAVIVFQAYLLTLFWGGMGSFGSRVWWMLLPICIYIWAEKIFLLLTAKKILPARLS
ncbi:hypothetical protein [Halomonas sp. KM-1]|uniref:hypothetical protein n=1 Tax=Halomonas sp. KM-1 TaxID=590061 RepID=UPI0002DEB947|nr:hypothetical protein [Halomonas sp. KM-1]